MCRRTIIGFPQYPFGSEDSAVEVSGLQGERIMLRVAERERTASTNHSFLRPDALA
jgi:hypothetical protein